jgi:hypothetical protein
MTIHKLVFNAGPVMAPPGLTPKPPHLVASREDRTPALAEHAAAPGAGTAPRMLPQMIYCPPALQFA